MGLWSSSKVHLTTLVSPPPLLLMAGGVSSLASLAIVGFLFSNYCWWSFALLPCTPAEFDLQLVETAGIIHQNRNPRIDDHADALNLSAPIHSHTATSGQCDVSQGEWVPDISPPLYTNDTCRYIQHSQNCLQNNRPDRDYLHWKWKPFDCELPPFNATRFLELMRGKKLAFIGDSLARNQMQSLHCILRQVEESLNLYSDPHEKEYRWLFPSHNFTLVNFQSRFLVNYTEPEGDIRKVYLDVPDPLWWTQLAEYDIAIVSTGYWYFTESLYHVNDTVWGVSKGSASRGLNATAVEMWSAMGIALQNVLSKMAKEYKGVIVLRTVTVDHFENGTWSTGGVCKRTSPFSTYQNGTGNIPPMDWISRKINKVQIEEYEKAMAYVDDTSRLRLLDVTYSAFLRPDGHPGTYRRQEPGEPVYDCLHWCLPGPIDVWNQLLLHTLEPAVSDN